MTQLTCFYWPLARRTIGAPVLSRQAHYISPTDIRCPVPTPQEFPLPCSCKCRSSTISTCVASLKASSGDAGITQKNISQYKNNGSPTYSSTLMSTSICSCCPAPGNGNCSVSLGIGVNLQNAAYGGSESVFLYSLDSPQVGVTCA